MKKINKNDIVEMVSEEAYLSKKDAKAAVELTFEFISEALGAGRDVDIANFGAFNVKTRKERIGTNPETHEKMILKERKMVSFKEARALKEKIQK
ncbi:MAG: HU family DNA-binding protein [Bacilli bacterium]|nr:HU family DNA-binding protein [Bacilli bacterium]